MRIRLAVPDELDDAERKEALNHALEAVTIANAGMMRAGLAPKITPLIKAGRVKWRPEPPGDEHFDLASTVVGRGWGDCDDLAPAYAGQLRATGRDPEARAFVRRSGPTRWHALVRRGDGTVEDPSRAAGMGHSVSGDGGDRPSIHHPMASEPRLCIAIRSSPNKRHWFARVDVPDRADDFSWTSVAHHLDPRAALLHAVKGASVVCGDEIDDEDEYRLSVLNDLVLGADPYEVAQALSEVAPDVDAMRVVLDGVQSVGFLDSLTRPFRKMLAPVAHAMDVVSPYVTPLFPGLAQVVDPVRAAIETGDPMAVYKAQLIPGARSGRDFFERNPLGHAAYAGLSPFLKNIPGGSTWLAAAAPRASAPHQASQVPAPPPLVNEILSMLMGQGGNAPPTQAFERGAPAVPFEGGPAFLRF